MTGEKLPAGPEPEVDNGRRSSAFRIATLIWSAIICVLAFRPSTPVEAGLPWDKLHHAAAFLLLTFLAGRGWTRLGWPGLALLTLAAGIGIELVQGLPAVGRDADVWDVVADMVGTAIGFIALGATRPRPVRG
jgi:VanZ family protein